MSLNTGCIQLSEPVELGHCMIPRCFMINTFIQCPCIRCAVYFAEWRVGRTLTYETSKAKRMPNKNGHHFFDGGYEKILPTYRRSKNLGTQFKWSHEENQAWTKGTNTNQAWTKGKNTGYHRCSHNENVLSKCPSYHTQLQVKYNDLCIYFFSESQSSK